MSTTSFQSGKAGCMAVPGSVEGTLFPLSHVADELSSPSREMVKDLSPKGPRQVSFGAFDIILSPPDFVGLVAFLPLKDLGSVWLTRGHKCPSDGSLLALLQTFSEPRTHWFSAFISLACSDVLAVVDFYGGICGLRPAQYY